MLEPGKVPLIKKTVYPSAERFYCQTCFHYFGSKLASEQQLPFIEWNYCPKCGTKMNWKKGE